MVLPIAFPNPLRGAKLFRSDQARLCTHEFKFVARRALIYTCRSLVPLDFH